MNAKEIYIKFWKLVEKTENKRVCEFTNNNCEDVFFLQNFFYDKCKNDNAFDIFIPVSNEEILPIIINIHGGGYVYGDKTLNTKQCLEYAKQGFVVINANYEKLNGSNEFSTSLKDVFKLIKFSSEFFGASNIGATNDFVFMGDSSGAHLISLALCILKDDNLRKKYNINIDINVKCCVFNSGVFEIVKTPILKSFENLFFKNNIKENQNLTSTLNLMKSNFPPSIVISSKFDPLNYQSKKFIKKCNELNIKNEFLLSNTLSNFGHCYNIANTEKKYLKM